MDYSKKATQDLDAVVLAMMVTKTCCYRIPINRLMETFQEKAKLCQLLVQFPDVCALVFARSIKKGHFCGFFKDITRYAPFNLKNLLAANRLPGPR